MPASFSLPPSNPYQGTAYPLESRLLKPPREGNRMVPLSINWGNDSASLQAIGFNLQNNTTNPFSQICAAYIDNLMSNVDIVLMFPDTETVLTVPAQSAGWYPLDTNALNFVARVPAGQAATSSDEVYINLYNYLPPPITVERSFVTSAGVSGGNTLTAGTTAQVINAGTNGVITAGAIDVAGVVAGAGAGNWLGILADGGGHTIANVSIGLPAAATLPYQVLWSVSGVNIPFTNGVTLVGTPSGTAFTAGGFGVNLYFR